MLSIVIPAFNEEKRLPGCLTETIKFLEKQDYDSEILVVCDGCSDRTAEIAFSYQSNYHNLKVIEYSPNRGKGYAVTKGMLESKGDIRMFMDADLAVPVETVNAFIKQISEGYDVVIGARGLKETIISEHQNFFRECAGKLFGRIQKLILNIPFFDTQCGFKIFSKNAVEYLFPKVKYDCSYFDAEVMYLAFRAGFKIKEMPVNWKHDGITRMPIGFSRAIDLFYKLIKLKSLHSEIVIEKNE